MSQIAKIIDVTRGFALVDPNAFAENMMYPGQEDSPEKAVPIVAIEGHNFLPTAYGIRSYFGLNSALDIDFIAARCDKIILFQLANFQNHLIALAEDGIWVSIPNVSGANWARPIDVAVPAPGSYRQWTYTLIENVLYFYRQGEATYWKMPYLTGIIEAVTPNFLNMAGQMGIFRANGRLGFWDSANSVSWSSLFDFTDFSPALETLAGNSIFNMVVGRIVNILAQGDGFVIYSTKSIVGVRYSTADVNILWDATQISNLAGIVYPFQVTAGQSDVEHFAWTNIGIKKLGQYNALNKVHAFDDIIPDVYDLLKESRDPIRLDLLGGRFLFLSVVDSRYINGRVLTSIDTVTPLRVRVLEEGGLADIDILGITVYQPATNGTVEDNITAASLGEFTQGLYTQWRAKGYHMIPSRMPSPINPYTLNEASVYVPGSGFDLTSKIAVETADMLLKEGTWIDPDTPKEYPNGGRKDLGWKYHGHNNVSDAFLGLADAALLAFKAVQIVEWNNYAIIQTETLSRWTSTTPYTAPVVITEAGTVPNGHISKMAQMIATDLSSHIGATQPLSQRVVWEELVAQIPTGVYTTATTGPTPSVHSSAYKFEATFTQQAKLIRQVRRDYSFTAVPETIYTGWFTLTDSIYGNPETIYLGDKAYTPIEFLAFRLAIMEARVASLPSSYDQGPPDHTIATKGISYLSPIDSTEYLVEYSNDTGSFIVIVYLSTHEYSFYYTYDVQTVDTHSPIVTTLSAPPLKYAVVATQKDLNWGIISGGLGPWADPNTYSFPQQEAYIPGIFLEGYSYPPLDITYPGSTFLLQDGSLAPIYPTYTGAFVLDLGLKKWGKMRANFKALVDYSPINTLQEAISYDNFGLDMGVLKADGTFALADTSPADSYITYGKICMYRLGMTKIHELIAHFRLPFTGTVTLNTSLDVRNLEATMSVPTAYVSKNKVTAYGKYSGRWHTVTISGKYDLQFLELRGTITSRR